MPKGLRPFSGLSRQRRLGIACPHSCMATSGRTSVPTCLQVGAVLPTCPLTPLHTQILPFHHCLAPEDILRCPVHLSRMSCTSNRVPMSLFSSQPDKKSLETLPLISFHQGVSYLQKSHMPTWLQLPHLDNESTRMRGCLLTLHAWGNTNATLLALVAYSGLNKQWETCTLDSGNKMMHRL